MGKDIRTDAKVALKIGRPGQSSSTLNHEYNVYTNIAGSLCTSSVLWYGKEDVYEIIVLEYLGDSVGDLIRKESLDGGWVFSHASQMVCSFYR
jgi:hypothetical protein